MTSTRKNWRIEYNVLRAAPLHRQVVFSKGIRLMKYDVDSTIEEMEERYAPQPCRVGHLDSFVSNADLALRHALPSLRHVARADSFIFLQWEMLHLRVGAQCPPPHRRVNMNKPTGKRRFRRWDKVIFRFQRMRRQ